MNETYLSKIFYLKKKQFILIVCRIVKYKSTEKNNALKLSILLF